MNSPCFGCQRYDCNRICDEWNDWFSREWQRLQKVFLRKEPVKEKKVTFTAQEQVTLHTVDSQENVDACLKCKRRECNNCISRYPAEKLFRRGT